jgi:hypothetical protein
MLLPPLATVYQLMVLPADVALRLALLPLHTVLGVAVTAVGAAGIAVTVTAAVAVRERLLHGVAFTASA